MSALPHIRLYEKTTIFDRQDHTDKLFFVDWDAEKISSMGRQHRAHCREVIQRLLSSLRC